MSLRVTPAAVFEAQHPFRTHQPQKRLAVLWDADVGRVLAIGEAEARAGRRRSGDAGVAGGASRGGRCGACPAAARASRERFAV